MDLALRTLREGRADAGAPAPLLLLLDTLAVVGGPAVLRHAVAELAAAIGGGRAQAAALTIVTFEHPPHLYQRLCSLVPALDLTVLDCFTDPYAWGSLLPSAGGSSGGTTCAVVSLPGILAANDGLQQLQQRLISSAVSNSTSGEDVLPLHQGSRRQHVIMLDSLSPLLDAFSPSAVAQLLHRLAAAPSTAGVLCGLHADLHAAPAVAAVEQLAAGALQLQPASDLERTVCAAAHGRAPQGRLVARLRRRNGRVRSETQLYHVDGRGSATFLEPPADLLNPAAVAEKAAAAAAAAGGDGAGQVATQLAGGMKLSLSRQEREARERVQLPFEHQGQGAAYQTGDWRDYLPKEAGGRAPSRANGASGSLSAADAAPQTQPGHAGQAGQLGGEALGRILYVRDSGSELDSDEDPDDDLDI